ncbi:right-handed parallel beta-helix repeat-containing protein [Aeoliella sp.]|uniref:right-handed parallel beta-helix repeat-containing protein n=1 Tax=Aeoliella sp. TaxID=2795800 RepID=UPI003CCC4028
MCNATWTRAEHVLAAGEASANAALAAAFEEIGNSRESLRLTAGKWRVAESLSVPENVHLRLSPAAVLHLEEGVTLNVSGSLSTERLEPIFAGKGRVRFADAFAGEVYPQWWAAVTGEDDTPACQQALDSGARKVRFRSGVYAIAAESGLVPRDHTQLVFDEGAVLRVIPNALPHYAIIALRDVQHVQISGATIIGDRQHHTATGGEWGHGIEVASGAHHIQISDCTVSDCWGDGIYIGGHGVHAVRVFDSTFDRSRRNACSITSARDVAFRRCTFSNTHGVSPGKGVDIEPNRSEDLVQEILFEDCRSEGNLTGGVTLAYDGSLDEEATVSFIRCQSVKDGFGFGLDLGPSDTEGELILRDCKVVDPGEDGFRTAGNLRTRIEGLLIRNPNQRGEPRGTFGHGVSLVIWPDRANSNKTVGNLTARNLTILSDDGKLKSAVYFENRVGDQTAFEQIDISASTNAVEAKHWHRGGGPFRGDVRVEVQQKVEQ